MTKHLIHQNDTFSCQKIFLESDIVPDIKHISSEKQM